MKKKIISALVAVSLFTTQVPAKSLKDFVYSNGTKPSTSNIGGNHYYFGGNYELRFKKNTYNFKPWFNGEPPRFHIGCNGISLSGGFISLLGLDDIKEQLDNASTAFAWGVIMGIKASLPIVSQVFETIQKWARTIQKLLQNMCSMGQALTKHIQKGDASQSLSNFFSEIAGDEGFAKQKSVLESLSAKADFVNEQVEKFTKINDDRGKGLVNKMLADKVKGSTISLATFYFGKYLPKIKNNDSSAIIGKLSDLYRKRVGDEDLKINNDAEFERAVLFHKLALLLFGEIGINKKAFDDLTQIIDNNGKVNKEKTKANIMKSITGMANDKKLVPVLIPNTITSGNAYAFLMKGAEAISGDNDACDKEGCNVKNLKFVYIEGPTNTAVNGSSKDSKNSKEKLKVFTLSTIEDSKTIRLEWKGFYKEGLNAIRNLVKQQSGISNYSFLSTQKAPDSTGETKFLFNGMGKYINILSKLAKKRGGETAYIYYLEKLLATRNAQTQTFLFVNNISSYLKALKSDPSTDFGPNAENVIKDYMDNVKKIQEDITKNITGTLKVDDSIYKMDKMFDEIDKNMKKETLKNVGF
jgi:hypothetical protein